MADKKSKSTEETQPKGLKTEKESRVTNELYSEVRTDDLVAMNENINAEILRLRALKASIENILRAREESQKE